MDETADDPMCEPPSAEAEGDVSRSDAELERQIELGLEILECYRKPFEALAS